MKQFKKVLRYALLLVALWILTMTMGFLLQGDLWPWSWPDTNGMLVGLKVIMMVELIIFILALIVDTATES